MGNPTTYLGHALTWGKIRQLESYRIDSNTLLTYAYDAGGIRIRKGAVSYQVDGTRILREMRPAGTITYEYGNGGVCGFQYDNTKYYYEKNLQGDITGIYDAGGNLKAEYVYDAWGNPVVTVDIDGIGTLNPFRYRGYYYDTETELYYLNSRYYDPRTCRFISADTIDSFENDQKHLLQYNIYIYCLNNPVMYYDSEGSLGLRLKLALTAGFIWGLYKTTSCIGMVLDSPGAWLQLGLSFAGGFIRGFYTVYSITSFKKGYGAKMVKGIISGLVNVVLQLIVGNIESPKDAMKAFMEGYSDKFVPSILPEKVSQYNTVISFFTEALGVKVS